MSKDLVRLDLTQLHLRVDVDIEGASPDDPMIKACITAASIAILNYIGGHPDFVDSDGDVITDSSGQLLVPADIQAATYLFVGELYKNREAEQDGAVDSQFGYGYLPRPVVAILYPYRQPVFS